MTYSCLHCGTVKEQTGPGRPRKYCSAECCKAFNAPAQELCELCRTPIERVYRYRYCATCKGMRLREIERKSQLRRKLRARAAAWAPTPEISGAV